MRLAFRGAVERVCQGGRLPHFGGVDLIPQTAPESPAAAQGWVYLGVIVLLRSMKYSAAFDIKATGLVI